MSLFLSTWKWKIVKYKSIYYADYVQMFIFAMVKTV